MKIDLNTTIRSRAEHDAWRKLCGTLRGAGAVTDDDLSHPATATATPGDCVFAAIREWGAALVALRTPTTATVVMANDCPEAVVLTPANVAAVTARVQAQVEDADEPDRVVVHTHEVTVTP